MKSKYLLLLLLPALLVTGCKKKAGPPPTVETVVPGFVASRIATIGCRVTSDGGQAILANGIYINESTNPDLNTQPIKMGADTGLFLGVLHGLTPDTKYYIKAYATNAGGQALGNEISFTTPATFPDNDGHGCDAVIIGDQTWMAENLHSVNYRNGDPIGTTTSDISSENSPVYYWYANGDYTTSLTYGLLYTWYAVTDSRNVCPAGWHIPSDAEWTTLEDNLGGYLIAGSSLKEYGTDHWLAPYNTDASNLSCFTALPAGYRPATGGFALLQNEAHFWSATESETAKAYERSLSASSYSVGRQGAAKNSGLSVRCIKD
jgi:uncharacterized protein (TIGR02145 family)